MFTSFSLYNFYQQPNTGFEPHSLNSGILLSGNAQSGKVADFNWYFPYASTNILINSLLAQSRFGYHIWADSYGAVVPGLHYGTVSTSMSGTFGANYNSIYFGDQFYGAIFPELHELFNTQSSFSGLFTGVHFDAVSETNVFSGRFTGQEEEMVLCSHTFSGNIQSLAEPIYVNSVLSGIINKAPEEGVSGNYRMTGDFWPVKTDLCTMNYVLSSFVVSSGVTVISGTQSDHANLSFTLVGYQVNT